MVRAFPRICAEKRACVSSPFWLTMVRYRTSTACKVGAGMSDDGMMHSDHRPVFIDFDI